MVGVTKRRHVSKKSKTSWRKNTNIQDVENFLDDKRLEERLGTCFADKPDSELFVIDTAPSHKENQITSDADNLTSRQKKILRLPETPRCFQALVNTSKVPEPSGKRNNLKPKGINPVTEKKKIARGVYKRKLEMAKENRQLESRRKAGRRDLRANVNRDLWADDVKPSQPDPEWLALDTKNVNKPAIVPRKPKGKLLKSKSIAIPDPGTSYNPTLKDHQSLIQRAVAEELVVMKEETHLNRVTSGMFRKVTRQRKMEEDMQELRQGLPDTGETEDHQDDGEEYKAINPPVVNKKKTRKVKTHVRQDKLIKVKKMNELAEKKKLGEVYKLRFIQKDIEKNETLNSEIRERRKTKKIENPPLPRINSRTYVEPAPVYAEVKELSGNLRGLVPKGGGLPDHFVSLQRRGIAPVSVPLKLKKAKKKRYTLPSHKMPWEITEGFAKPSKRNSSTQ